MEQKGLDNLPGWSCTDDGKRIFKIFTFSDFEEALAFTNKVGELAEEENHHPNIELSWGKVVVTLWTHSANSLTEKDFVLAEKIERL